MLFVLPAGQITNACVLSGCTCWQVLSPSTPVAAASSVQIIGRWRAGNLINRQAKGQWTKSMHNPVDQIRPVRVQNLVVIATDVWDAYQDVAPFMWSMGSTMSFLFSDIETEQFDWGFKPPTLKTYQEDAEYQNIPQMQEYVFNDLDAESEQFAFNAPIIIHTISFDEDELPDWTVIFDQWDVESDNWGWKPPVLATSRNELFYSNPAQFTAYAQPPYLDTDYDMAQATFFALEQYGEVQELPPAQQGTIVPEIEDEQFSWGLNTSIYGGSGTQLMGFRGFWALKAGMGSLDEWSFNPPVVAAPITAFDEDQFPLPGQPDAQWTDDDSAQATFFALEQYADVEEQFVITSSQRIFHEEDFGFNTPAVVGELLLDEHQIENSPYPDIQQVEDEQFGMRPPFIISVPFDDTLDQLPNKPYPTVAEDDLVFPASSVLPNIFYDADFNPTMQQSYYFGSEDLEKYNWGWLPPMTKVAEDDSVYDSQPQAMSYFFTEPDTETDNFGLWRYFSFDQDESRPSTNIVVSEDEPFGFNQPVVVTKTGFDQDELIPQQQKIYAEDELTFPTFFVAQEREFDIPNPQVNVQDEERQIAFFLIQDFAQNKEIDHLLNAPYPITFQTENDQFGQNAPFIISQPFAWEEAGVPPNPPYPVVDEPTFNGIELFVPSRVVVYATGQVIGIREAGQVIDLSTTGSISTVVDGGGKVIGYLVSGTVKVIKGGN